MPTVNTSDETTRAVGNKTCSSWTLETSNTDKVKIVLKRKFPMSSNNQTECLGRDRIPSQSCVNGGYDEGSLFENIKRWRATRNSDPGPTRCSSSDGVPSSQQPSPRDSGIDVGSPTRRDADGPGDQLAPDAFGRSTVTSSEARTTKETVEENECMIIDSSSEDDAGVMCEDVSPANETISPRCLFTMPGGAKRFLSTSHGEKCFESPTQNDGSASQCISISSSTTSLVSRQSTVDCGLFVSASSSETSICARPPSCDRGSTTISRSSSEMSCLDEPPVCGGVGKDSRTSYAKNESRTERNIFEFITPVPDDLVTGIMSSLNKTSVVARNRPIDFVPNWKSKLKFNSRASNTPSTAGTSAANRKWYGHSESINEGKNEKSFANGAGITSSTSFSTNNLLPRRSSLNVPSEIKPRKEDYVSEYAQFLLSSKKNRRHTEQFPIPITDVVNNNVVHKRKSKNINLQKNSISNRPSVDTGLSFNKFGSVKNIFPPSSKCELQTFLAEIDKNQARNAFSNTFENVQKIVPPSTECELPMLLSKISKNERSSSFEKIKSVNIMHNDSQNRRLNSPNDLRVRASGIISNDRLSFSIKTLPDGPNKAEVARPGIRSLTSQRISSFYNNMSDSETVVMSSLTKCMKRTSIDRDGSTATGVKCESSTGSNLKSKILLNLKPADFKKCDPVKHGKQTLTESMELETANDVSKPLLNQNEKRTLIESNKRKLTNFTSSTSGENVNLTSTKNVIKLTLSKVAKESKITQAQSLQSSFHRSQIDRRTNDKYRVSPEREACVKRKGNSSEIEPTRKTSRTPRPNSRYVNDFSLNDDDLNDKADREELIAIVDSPSKKIIDSPSKKNSTRQRTNLRNNIASFDVAVTVRQYELLDRLRLRTLQIIERLLPTYSVYPAILPNEHSPAVDRLVEQIIDVLSDAEPRLNVLSARLQPRVSLCRSPTQCTSNFRRRFVRLLQLLLPDIGTLVDGISTEEVDRLADAVISANEEDTY